MMRSLAATLLATGLAMAGCNAAPRQPAPYPDTRPEQLTRWTLMAGGRRWWLGGVTAESESIRGAWVRTESPFMPGDAVVEPVETGEAPWTVYNWTEADCSVGALRFGERVVYSKGKPMLARRQVGPRWVKPVDSRWLVLLRSLCEAEITAQNS